MGGGIWNGLNFGNTNQSSIGCDGVGFGLLFVDCSFKQTIQHDNKHGTGDCHSKQCE